MGHSSIRKGVSPRAAWAWLALFLATVGLLGGSSRTDPAQLMALRPVAALFLVPAFYYLGKGDWKEQRFLLSMLALLALWMLVQLVPLPPSIWHALPGREPIVEMDALLGLQDLWRPISLTPWRGWNALASLVVPAAGMLLAISMRASSRQLLQLLAVLGVTHALLGLLQLAAGPNSAFYFYAYTNNGSPVGVLANENHAAMFSAITLLILTKLGLDGLRLGEQGAIRIAYPFAFLLVVITRRRS